MSLMRPLRIRNWLALLLVACSVFSAAIAEAAAPKGPYPPKLPGDQAVATDTSEKFIQIADSAKQYLKMEAFTVAKTAPAIDFAYLPGQDFPGNPWSAWGDGCAADGKFYCASGDHKYNAFVYEWDLKTKKLRMLLDIKKFLQLPTGQYTPGKVHSLMQMGSDGCLYYSTHRGSSSYTDGKGGEKHSYKGDWVLKTNPASGESEILLHGEVPYSLPVGQLDPERLIYYCGTQQENIFFALDCKTRKVLFQSEPGQGPHRYVMRSSSTGKVYIMGNEQRANGTLGCYDPKTNKLTAIPQTWAKKVPNPTVEPKQPNPKKAWKPFLYLETMDIRSCTAELPGGIIYIADWEGCLWKFDVKTEKAEKLGSLSIGTHDKVITSIDADPTGRYLYYVGGSHGGIAAEGMPIKQYDTKTAKIKVIAFLNPFYLEKYGYNPDGTYCSAVSPDGSTMYVNMNGCLPGNVGAKNWYACGLFVIHIPESERKP